MFLKGSTNIHKSMIADRYRKEQDFVRGEGIKNCKEKNLAIETNAGVGNLTKLYEANFKKVITNDINPNSIATYNMDSLDFVRDIVNNLLDKVDLIDFDFYGCPAEAVKEYFLRIKNDVPVIICISDGLGLWMKMRRDLKRIKERFLLDEDWKFKGGQFDERHPWQQHIYLWDNLFTKLSKQHRLKVEPIKVLQTKGKNYVLGSYLITK